MPYVTLRYERTKLYEEIWVEPCSMRGTRVQEEIRYVFAAYLRSLNAVTRQAVSS